MRNAIETEEIEQLITYPTICKKLAKQISQPYYHICTIIK